MKLRHLTSPSLLLSLLLASAANAEDPAPANAERLLNGGMGYDFSLTYEEAQDRGLSQVGKQEFEGEELSTIVPGEFFPLHLLTYTLETRKLYKIAGMRGYTQGAHGHAMNVCLADFASVKDGIQTKYPGLKPAGQNQYPEMKSESVCERTPNKNPWKQRSSDDAGGRCINLMCTGDEKRAYLRIEYADTDLTIYARLERAEKKRLKQEEAIKARGFDPSKL